ncbi:uncharacterized protein LOC110027950 [Phalaenopsis equestris]|uniref:uncharacterized protein LOC110027950 n=1 Tax=Phalaenopsis equestris TaxID=78828 RepID=UPI0009E1C89C|nr:uncharacterized protein LOC110027950 [Phalaenopsis equestris]
MVAHWHQQKLLALTPNTKIQVIPCLLKGYEICAGRATPSLPIADGGVGGAAAVAARRSSRGFSDKGRVLSEEEMAAETIYIQKMEKEKLEKMKRKAEKEKAEAEKKKAEAAEKITNRSPFF